MKVEGVNGDIRGRERGRFDKGGKMKKERERGR